MDPENDGAESQSAAPAPEAPSWATDALDALIGDDYSEVDEETPEGGPSADADLEPDGDESEPPESGDDSTDDETSVDAADEPEELKDILKGLSRSQRGKILSHYRSRAEATLQEAQAIEERSRQEASAREAKATEIREQRGQFVGAVEGKRQDGTPIPTYKEIERLLRTDDGEDVLDDKYGLSLSEARAQLREWDQRIEMLDGSLEDHRTEAWVESGKQLAVSIASAGLPLDAVWKDVKGIADVVPSVVRHLTTRHQAELATQKKDYEGRLKAATANGTATAARTAARTLPQPETGGRGDAGGARIYRESELEDMEFFRAHEADIDRALAEGRIVPG